jgi:hypothetical protein
VSPYKTTLCIILLFSAPFDFDCASGQDRLEPEVGRFAEKNEYMDSLRSLFGDTFKEGVVLRALNCGSINPEWVVGLKKGDKEGSFDVMLLEAESVAYFTLSLEKAKRAGRNLDDGQDPDIAYMRKVAPLEFSKIRVKRAIRPVPANLASDISLLWETMLLQTGHLRQPHNGPHGEMYYFSGWFIGYGTISGKVWSPGPPTKPGQLAEVAKAMSDFAKGKIQVDALKNQVEKAKAAILDAPDPE